MPPNADNNLNTGGKISVDTLFLSTGWFSLGLYEVGDMPGTDNARFSKQSNGLLVNFTVTNIRYKKYSKNIYTHEKLFGLQDCFYL